MILVLMIMELISVYAEFNICLHKCTIDILINYQHDPDPLCSFQYYRSVFKLRNTICLCIVLLLYNLYYEQTFEIENH